MIEKQLINGMNDRQLIFEKSRPGRKAYSLPACDIPDYGILDIPADLLCADLPALPELSEPEVARHFSRISQDNYGVDTGFYPLGSCTMKYNPKINEELAADNSLCSLHPLQDDEDTQGILNMLYTCMQFLCELTGMQWGSFQPFAGAHGEFTAMKMFKAYFSSRNELKRSYILVPDSSHGTNPASARLAGFSVIQIKSNSEGIIDPEAVSPCINENLAGIMLTNPNTLGFFERHITQIADMVHSAGGLLYYDGANLNPILGRVRPGDMGFDAMHVNLHKTFSTPHGGGGPGSGPVLVGRRLVPFLPAPILERREGRIQWSAAENDNGLRMSGFHGNVGVIIKALAFIMSNGGRGLKRIGEYAVLNANYLWKKMTLHMHSPHPSRPLHEFVLSLADIKRKYGIGAIDLAKFLIDRGFHPPTVYFPLIVPEAVMIEPGETETQGTLDDFAAAFTDFLGSAEKGPDFFRAFPSKTPVRRPDETRAAREPVVRWVRR